MHIPKALGLALLFVCPALLVANYTTGPMIWRSAEDAVVNSIVERFSIEKAHTSFMSYATKLTPLKRLELAQLTQVEVFDRSSQLKLFWDSMKLPEVVVRATVPVEYTYFVELNDEWTIEMTEEALTIVSPPLFAGTPSPDISSLEFEVRKGSLFRSERKVAQALRKELTKLLKMRAQENTKLVRETAREQIKALARQWLSSEMQSAEITVEFIDEKLFSDQLLKQFENSVQDKP